MLPVWGGTEEYIIKASQVIQNRAAQIVTKLSRLSNQLAQHPAVNLLQYYSTSIEYQIPWQAKVYTIAMKINCRFNYRNKGSSSRNLCSRWLLRYQKP